MKTSSTAMAILAMLLSSQLATLSLAADPAPADATNRITAEGYAAAAKAAAAAVGAGASATSALGALAGSGAALGGSLLAIPGSIGAAFAAATSLASDIKAAGSKLLVAKTQAKAAGVNAALDAAISKISGDVGLAIGALADLSKGAGLALTNGVTAVHTAVAPLKKLHPAVLKLGLLGKELTMLISFLEGLADASVANPGFAAAVAPITGGLTLLKTQLTALQTALAGSNAGLLGGLSGALGAIGIGPGIGFPDISGLVNTALGLISGVVPALTG